MYMNALEKKGVDKTLLLETLEQVNSVAMSSLFQANTSLKKTKQKIVKKKVTAAVAKKDDVPKVEVPKPKKDEEAPKKDDEVPEMTDEEILAYFAAEKEKEFKAKAATFYNKKKFVKVAPKVQKVAPTQATETQVTATQSVTHEQIGPLSSYTAEIMAYYKKPEVVTKCTHVYNSGKSCTRDVITGTTLCKFHTTAVKHTIQVMLGDTNTSACKTILKSGKNSGKVCGIQTLPGEECCKVHYILKVS